MATRAALSDTAAPTYEEYVAARWTALYRTAYLLTGSHVDAEDLAQSTLVKAYRSWNRITATASPDAYVRRIMNPSRSASAVHSRGANPPSERSIARVAAPSSSTTTSGPDFSRIDATRHAAVSR